MSYRFFRLISSESLILVLSPNCLPAATKRVLELIAKELSSKASSLLLKHSQGILAHIFLSNQATTTKALNIVIKVLTDATSSFIDIFLILGIEFIECIHISAVVFDMPSLVVLIQYLDMYFDLDKFRTRCNLEYNQIEFLFRVSSLRPLRASFMCYVTFYNTIVYIYVVTIESPSISTLADKRYFVQRFRVLKCQ